MKKLFIYIDDSGSPGQEPANKHVDKDTKIWAAVLLSSEEISYINTIIESTLKIIQRELHISEMHFTNIYSGKNGFKDVDSQLRLEIFNLFTDLYNSICPYVIVTAIGKNTLKNVGFSETYIRNKIDGFNYSNPSDYALYSLLLNIQEYIYSNYNGDELTVEIIVDEGRQKANTKQNISSILTICSEINYKSSADVYGLQFIDFIAFSINRIQNNISKDRSSFDNEFMKIVGKLQLNSNLELHEVNELEALNKTYWESVLDNIEVADKDSVKYLETLTNEMTFIKRIMSGKKTLDGNTKLEVLNSINAVKKLNYSRMTEEFRSLLDSLESQLNDVD